MLYFISLSARLQYLHCWCSGDTVVSCKAIDLKYCTWSHQSVAPPCVFLSNVSASNASVYTLGHTLLHGTHREAEMAKQKVIIKINQFQHITVNFYRVRLWRWSCLVTWFCYHMIAKPGNKTGTPSWPDPHAQLFWQISLCICILHHLSRGGWNLSHGRNYLSNL